ncbi:MAG: carbonic anhydrase [Thermoactinomyces sp.]
MANQHASNAKALLQSNQKYAERFNQGNLPIPPARKVAVVTCMDARLDPLAFLDAQLGDIHVIRNAGGRVTEDVIRSLVISEQLLNTEEIIVIHHTDCGMLTFKNEDLYTRIDDTLGEKAGQEARKHDFLPFTDLAESVRKDIETLRQSALIPENIRIYGGIYDVHTGKVEVVE